jgi:hypothetical protein
MAIDLHPGKAIDQGAAGDLHRLEVGNAQAPRGGYYLLLQFAVSFGKRIPEMPLYALFLIPLALVFALRMIAMASRQTPRTVEAG